MAPVFRPLQISSVGTHVAYGVTWVEAGADHHELWIASMSGLDDPLLVEVRRPVASLAWSPGADVLAVAYDVGSSTPAAIRSQVVVVTPAARISAFWMRCVAWVFGRPGTTST